MLGHRQRYTWLCGAALAALAALVALAACSGPRQTATGAPGSGTPRVGQASGPAAGAPQPTSPPAVPTPTPQPAAREPAAPAVEIVEPELANPNSWTFTPQALTVPVGTTVTWVNKGVIGHTVAIGPTESRTLMQGETFQHTFAAPGEAPYFCGIHSWMTGTVVVSGG